MEGLVAVGRIGKSVGIHGEFRLLPFNASRSRYRKLKNVFVGLTDADATPAKVTGIRFTANDVVMMLAGFETPEALRPIQEKLLFVTQEESVRPGKGSYLIHDLVGAHVVTEEGKEVGILHEVLSRPPNDLWVVRNGTQEILIPAVREFIKSVRTDKNEIVIHEIEGLLE